MGKWTREQLKNGGFDDDLAYWEKDGEGINWAAGEAVFTTMSGGANLKQSYVDANVGETFVLRMKITALNGVCSIFNGGVKIASYREAGFKTESFTITQDKYILISVLNFAKIDWISVAQETEPVVERIAQNIESVINSITVEAGYWQALSCVRPKLVDWMDVTPEENKVLMIYEDEENSETEALNTDERRQRFDCLILQFGGESDNISLDTRCIRAAADLQSALMADVTRGGLAIDTTLLPLYFSRDEEFPGIAVPFQVLYRTKFGDPYLIG
jgi:hypothetical protein